MTDALIMSVSASAEASSRSSTLTSLSEAKAAALMAPAIAIIQTTSFVGSHRPSSLPLLDSVSGVFVASIQMLELEWLLQAERY